MKSTPILAGCFLASLSLVFVGCGKTTIDTNVQNATSTTETAAQAPAQDKFASDTALSNPATVYCLEQGGKFTMGKSFNGSSEGYCTLPSNITCEVWAHYNGDCPVGSKKKKPTSTSASTTNIASSTNTTNADIGAEHPSVNDTENADTNSQVPTTDAETGAQGLVLTAEPGEDAGEIVTRWKTNGLSAPEGFIIMLSGQEQVSYPTKYFHLLQNPLSRSFIWNDLVPDKTYFFRVCIVAGEECGTYSAVANTMPK